MFPSTWISCCGQWQPFTIGRSATTRATLTHFECQKVLMICNIWAVMVLAFYMSKMKFPWISPENLADQSSTHRLAQFQSLIGLWVKLRHLDCLSKSALSYLTHVHSVTAANLKQQPIQEQGISTDSNWRAPPADGAIIVVCLGDNPCMNLNWSRRKSAAKTVVNNKQC